MKKLAILGASGHGKVVADAAILMNKWEQIDFYDDGYPQNQTLEQWQVFGNSQVLVNKRKHYDSVIVAIGINKIRLEKQHFFLEQGCNITTIIHPKATISPHASLAIGTIVMAGAVINPFSTLGEACIVNTNAVVEHDCKIDEAVHICPGSLLAGNVSVGKYTTIGIGSCIRQGVSISDNIMLGAGSVVVNDLFEPGTYTGIPAIRNIAK